ASSSNELTEAVRHRLASWKIQYPFGAGDWLERRLSQEGLDEAAFIRLLGASPDALWTSGSAPGWLSSLTSAFTGAAARPESAATLEGIEAGSLSGFVGILAPLLRAARRRLREGMDAIAGSKGEPILDREGVGKTLFESLPRHLVWML